MQTLITMEILDLIVNNIDEEAFVYRNDAESLRKNNYLRIKCNPDKSSSALHTRVKVYHGEHLQFQEMLTSRGYLSAVDGILHFGMGKENKVDSIRIDWINGKTQLLTNVDVKSGVGCF